MVVYHLMQKMNEIRRQKPKEKYLHPCPDDFKKKSLIPLKIVRFLKREK